MLRSIVAIAGFLVSLLIPNHGAARFMKAPTIRPLSSSVLFVGVPVATIRQTEAPAPEHRDYPVATRFRVVKVLNGKVPEPAVVLHYDGVSCGNDFQLGVEYVISARSLDQLLVMSTEHDARRLDSISSASILPDDEWVRAIGDTVPTQPALPPPFDCEAARPSTVEAAIEASVVVGGAVRSACFNEGDGTTTLQVSLTRSWNNRPVPEVSIVRTEQRWNTDTTRATWFAHLEAEGLLEGACAIPEDYLNAAKSRDYEERSAFFSRFEQLATTETEPLPFNGYSDCVGIEPEVFRKPESPSSHEPPASAPLSPTPQQPAPVVRSERGCAFYFVEPSSGDWIWAVGFLLLLVLRPLLRRS